jgi:hypothetical protein
MIATYFDFIFLISALFHNNGDKTSNGDVAEQKCATDLQQQHVIEPGRW